MTLDFCAIVEPLAPKYSAISDDDVLNRELLLNIKLMLQIVYTEAAAHISTLPDCSGQERLRHSFCTSFVHSSTHSSSKCSLQKATASSITFASLSFSCCLSICIFYSRLVLRLNYLEMTAFMTRSIQLVIFLVVISHFLVIYLFTSHFLVIYMQTITFLLE